MKTDLLLQCQQFGKEPASQFSSFDSLAYSVKRSTHTTHFSYTDNKYKLEAPHLHNLDYSLNCDASVYGINSFEVPISPQDHNSILGGIIKYKDQEHFVFRKNVICRDNNIAELMAIYEGLEIAHFLGIDSLNIYTDSSVSIKFIKNHYLKHEQYFKKEKFVPFTEAILSLLDKFKVCNFFHVPRKENKIADKITKHKNLLHR